MWHKVLNIPPGWRGTDVTVAEANRLVASGLTDPVVVLAAQNIVRHLPERDKMAEVRAISNYVRGKIRYTNEGIETLKAPRLMLDEIKRYGRAVGDCDDHVILWAALNKAVGNPVRFKVISQRRDKFANHIYGEVHVPGRGWVADDLIVKHQPIGWRIPPGQISKSKTYLAGLGGVGQTGGYNMPRDYFTPGGGSVTDTMLLAPRKGVFAVKSMVARGYMVAPRGGPVTVGPGGRLGRIGAIGRHPSPEDKSKAEEELKRLKGFDYGALITSGAGLVAKYKEMRAAKKAARRARRRERREAAAEARSEWGAPPSRAAPTPAPAAPATGPSAPKTDYTPYYIGGAVVALVGLVSLLRK